MKKNFITSILQEVRGGNRQKYYKPDFRLLVAAIEGKEKADSLKNKYGENNYSAFTKQYFIELAKMADMQPFFSDSILSVFGLLDGYENEPHLIDRRKKFVSEARAYYNMDISLDSTSSINASCIRNENKAFEALQDWYDDCIENNRPVSLADDVPYKEGGTITLPQPRYLE